MAGGDPFAAKSAGVEVGERVLGRFTVAERLGRGGYGTVHKAWDERLCRHVAVKEVEGPAAGRVIREAHAAARLNHPGIVTLYELGEANGVAYLVSELVNGPNLREYAGSGALSDRDLAELGAELCAALGHAHAQGVVHRDLKPDNVLIRRARGKRMRASGERALLADFGIAALADEASLTATGQVVGTLAYMAPEQAAGAPAGPSADVYSLALTLYELWTGANPVARSTPAATARAIGQQVPTLAESRPELPAGLHAVIDAALQSEPDERPTLIELRSALEGVAGSLHPERAVPEPEEPAVPSASLSEVVPARPFAVLLAAGAIVALGVLAGRPGVAVVAALLLAPSALLLSRPAEWLSPLAAPALGLVGLAPLYTIVAARHQRAGARVALTALAWAWTGVLAAALGRGLGVVAAGPAAATNSESGAIEALLGPLLTAESVSVGLIWVGAAILLGVVLEFAGPALLAILGIVWAAGLLAALGAVGGAAAPALLLTPGIVAAVGWLVWDRVGRPEIAALPAQLRLPLPAPVRSLLGPGSEPAPAPARRPPRNPPEAPLPDASVRARRAAARHVGAALHGAGSHGGLP